MIIWLAIFFTVITLFVWGYFIIAKINFYKFKDYSHYIVPATKILAILLSILTLFWYYEIYKYSTQSSIVKTVQESAVNDVY